MSTNDASVIMTESEALIRASASVAKEKASPDAEVVVIKVQVKGVGAWVLDSTGDIREQSEAEREANVQLSYASDEVFVGLANKHMDPRAAVLTGKLSIRGDMALAARLGDWMYTVVARREATGDQLQVAPRDQWEKDQEAGACAVCRQEFFKVYRRKHHCRYCGRVVCDGCSSAKVGGQRACKPCKARADAARMKLQQALLKQGVPDGLAEKAKDAAPVATKDLEILQTRVVELEQQVETLDRRAFTARAAVLRQVVLSFYRALAVSLLALVLLGAHFIAGATSRKVGPSLFEVSVEVPPLSDLSSFSKGGAHISSAIRGITFQCSAEAANMSVKRSLVDHDEVCKRERADGGPADKDEQPSITTDDEVMGDVVRRRHSLEGASGLKEADFSGAEEGIACDANGCVKKVRQFSEQQQQQQQQQQPGHPTENGRSSSDGGRIPEAPDSRILKLSLSVYWAIMTLTVIIIREHQRRTEGLLLRRIKTFCLAGFVIFSLKMTRIKTRGMKTEESDETWDDVHKLMAPYVYQSILDISGMWVKTGQYLSSRADVMPQPYLNELSKLQDSVPASPYAEIEETVQKELGRPLASLFASIEEEALASASVAQVHRCVLKDGRQGVIKIQHRRVRQLFLEDLKNVARLVNFVAWAEKEYDFRPIMNEWSSECTKELDFFMEANNLARVGAAMHRSGLDTIIPELVPEFTRTKVVVMTFCKGFKVTDAKALDAANLDREAIMRSVTQSFAYQIHVDGMFNGDPHPGNILIQTQPDGRTAGGGNATTAGGERDAKDDKAAAVPVLLDWGLAKTLPEHLRVAFSRFVYSAVEHDFVSMLIAFEEMGIKLNRFDPAEDMHNIRFLLRDTQPPDEAKQDTIKFARRIKKKKASGLKQPVDAYPGDLLFFLRVTMLLRGLAARLNVRQQYMDVMAPYAKQALCEMVPVAERATQAIYPSPVLSPLESKVRTVLEELVRKGKITGCQVCVIYRGRRLVDLCAGQQGPVDPRPVKPSTVFCVFSAGKAVCATAVHLLADRGLLGYDQRLSEFWPAFACDGKEGTTVRHVLTHSTGLQHSFPERATFDNVCNWQKMVQVLEEAKPAWPPGSRASYHYFTFGWLVAAVVEKVSGCPFEEFVRREIAGRLNIQDSFFMGSLDSHGVDDTRVASIEHTFKPPPSLKQGGTTGAPADETEIVGIEDDEIAAAGEGGEGADRQGGLLGFIASALKESDPEEGTAVEELARKLRGREYFFDPRMFNHKQMRDACIPAANGHFTAKALAVMYDSFLESLGLSDGQTRLISTAEAGVVRGNGHGRGSGGGGDAKPPLLTRSRVNEMRSYQITEKSALHLLFGLPSGGVRYSLGYQMFGFREKAPQVQQQQQQQQQERPTRQPNQAVVIRPAGTRGVSVGGAGGWERRNGGSRPSGRVRLSGFGHVGMGGSVALCDPASGLAFAMTTNKVADGRESSSKVLSLVCEELCIGDPSHFFED